MSNLRALMIPLGLIFMAGCGQKSGAELPVRAERQVTAFQAPGTDPWKLVWTDPKTSTPAVLWNGLIGVRIGPSGTGFDTDGKPLPFFMSEEYDTSGEEKIRALPNPLAVTLDVGGTLVQGRQPSNWRQSLDMRSGLVTTEWTETSPSAGSVTVRLETAIHPTERVLGQRWTVTAEKDAPIVVRTGFAGDQGGEWETDVATFANGRLKARFHQMFDSPTDPKITRDGNSLRFDGMKVTAGKPFSFERTMAFALSPNYVDLMRARGTALKMAASAFEPGTPPEFALLAQESARIWKERWKTDIAIDGPVEDQQAVRSFLFYLRSAIHPEGTMSISPMGLSSETYGGHVFWDADLWVAPALTFVDPAAAKSIYDYRLSLQRAYEKNWLDWTAAGRPTATGKVEVDPQVLAMNRGGLMVPWESSVSGKETVPGPSKREHHITGTTAFSLDQGAALGLVDPTANSTFQAEAKRFFFDRIEKSAEGQNVIKGVMSPDENHTGDNDLYTNLVAQWSLNDGIWNQPASRDYQPPVIYLPKDATSFLTYDSDPIKSYKQAAAVLSIYPLQYPDAEKQAKVMMDRFADKVIKNGPAMTDSVHAIIWARLGETGKAYEAWRKGWMEFVQPPFLLFSEKRGQDRTYFTTGAAGELQSVIYGFLGFRIDSQKQAGAEWSLKLKGDRWLSIKPNLPKAWKRVTFRNFHVLGKSYTLTATHESVQVTQGE